MPVSRDDKYMHHSTCKKFSRYAWIDQRCGCSIIITYLLTDTPFYKYSSLIYEKNSKSN